MAKSVWRYTMTVQEQKLWDNSEMKGWRIAMEAYVEDEARERGCAKYVIISHANSVVAENAVKIPPKVIVATTN